jgi:DNA-binding LacI/PurR family transcriptional regulator
VDGFVLSDLGYNDPRVPVLQKLNVPLVAFGRTDDNTSFPYVDVDGCSGVRDAVEHLLDQGHRRIAFLGWPENSRVGDDRLRGYWEAMQAAGLEVDPAWVKHGSGEYDYGYACTHELLDLPSDHRPTAIVTVFDAIAVGAIRAIEERSLMAGRDVAVTGFDDLPVLHYLRPGLTTLRQPAWNAGQRVIEMLVNLLEGRNNEDEHLLLPPELVVRESSMNYQPD